MTELEELRQRVAILEETLDTLKQMQLSEQLEEYISSQQRMLNITRLMSSISNETFEINASDQIIEDMKKKKKQLDANVKKRLDEAKTRNIDEDWSEVFEYQVYENDVEITGFIGDDMNVIIPAFIEGKPVTKIADKAFLGSKIESIIFPSTLQRIGEYAFQKCYNLREILLPDSVTYLSDYCFSLTGIETINFGKVMRIPDRCLWKCSSLKDVILSDKTEVIGMSSFEETSLKSIVIPESVSKINYETFRESEISNIYFEGRSIEFSYDVFESVIPKPTLHCYKDSDAHKYAIQNNLPVDICDVKELLYPTKTSQKKTNTQPKRTINNANSSSSVYPKVGDNVTHTTYGVGTVLSIDNKFISVKFESKTAKFAMPDIFTKGFLK